MAKTKKPTDLPKDGSKSDKQQKEQSLQQILDTPMDSAMAALFGQGLKITFIHIPTGYAVDFPAMLTSFDDSFNAEYQGQKVYGRMDQIAVYTGTTRLLNFGFDIVATTPDEAIFNLGRLGRLESFMYPAYDGDGKTGTSTISAAPLMRVKFGNLIQNSNNDGLLGYINVVNTAPNFDHGFVIDEAGNMYPKAYSLNITFNVLHEHELGWYKDGENWKWRGDKKSQYPYDRSLPDGNSFQKPPELPADSDSSSTNNQGSTSNEGRTADGAKAKKSKAKDKIDNSKRKKVLSS
tara:strand:- start:6295 stop:7170 length:876 start_codon:yes stop_codon:yes gene_type:complete